MMTLNCSTCHSNLKPDERGDTCLTCESMSSDVVPGDDVQMRSPEVDFSVIQTYHVDGFDDPLYPEFVPVHSTVSPSHGLLSSQV